MELQREAARNTGRVSRIAPMLEEASRVAKMEAEVANDSLLLKPGMFTRVSVITDKKERTAVVPNSAVVSRNGENGVFIVEGDGNAIARYVPVHIGLTSTSSTEILSPVINGLVVTLGQHLLEDGSPVILPQAQKTGDNEPLSPGQKPKPPNGKEGGR